MKPWRKETVLNLTARWRQGLKLKLCEFAEDDQQVASAPCVRPILSRCIRWLGRTKQVSWNLFPQPVFLTSFFILNLLLCSMATRRRPPFTASPARGPCGARPHDSVDQWSEEVRVPAGVYQREDEWINRSPEIVFYFNKMKLIHQKKKQQVDKHSVKKTSTFRVDVSPYQSFYFWWLGSNNWSLMFVVVSWVYLTVPKWKIKLETNLIYHFLLNIWNLLTEYLTESHGSKKNSFSFFLIINY